MKKLAIILGILILGTVTVLAEEITPKQEINNNQAYFSANLQKQPQEGKQRQGISNHFTFFTINVQINGKFKDIPAASEME